MDAVLKVKEIGAYDKGDEKWKCILVGRDLTGPQLIDVAKQMHGKNPGIHYHIFDDDREINQYINWTVNYGKAFDKDGIAKYPKEFSSVDFYREQIKKGKIPFPFPEKWTKKHHKGMINKMLDFDRGGSTWQLTDQYGTKISSLD